MCIHERQLLLKSFLFNNYFYFFTDLSRFHCDIAVPFFFPVIFVVLTVVFCTVTEMTCFLPLASVMVTLIII